MLKRHQLKLRFGTFEFERDIEEDQKLSLCIRVMDLIQFSGIFHSRFSTKNVLSNSLTPEFLVAYFHAIHRV